MPSREEMVREAIARLDTAGVRSQLLKLDGVMMMDLGLRLTDKTVSVKAALDWLNGELFTPEDVAKGDGVDKNAVYRFEKHFRRIYEQVRAENARRIARLSVEHAT